MVLGAKEVASGLKLGWRAFELVVDVRAGFVRGMGYYYVSGLYYMTSEVLKF